MQPDKKILLVPVDFKNHTQIALNQAIYYAKALNAEVHMLYTVEPEGFFAGLFSDEDEDKLISNARKKLQEMADSIKNQVPDVHIMVAKGKIYETIVETAELIGANFIIMATGGSDTFKRRFIGSNTLRVIRSSKTPVISIRSDEPRLQVKNIILPLDIQKETREKVVSAVHLAKIFDATINVVSIIEKDEPEHEFKIEIITNQVKEFMADKRIDFTIKLLKVDNENKIGEAVVHYAQENDGDLIMIMTQQEINFTELFVGSAAQEIINTSNVPVCSIIPTSSSILSKFQPY
ncbi:MAG: universal stress protein [Flavobacteriales bacterium]